MKASVNLAILKRSGQTYKAIKNKMKKGKTKIINSHCLPFIWDKTVSIFNAVTGKEIVVQKDKFKDVTTDGGRFVQFYTFEIED